MFNSQVNLGVFALVPSVLLCFAVLATFYRLSNAYLAISWIPIALYLTLLTFLNARERIINSYDLSLMLESVCWTSLFQGGLGVVLLMRAFARKEERAAFAIAAVIASLPFIISRLWS